MVAGIIKSTYEIADLVAVKTKQTEGKIESGRWFYETSRAVCHGKRRERDAGR